MRHMVPLRAGHDYQFNVGAWLLVDNTSAVGHSGALAQVRCEIHHGADRAVTCSSTA
ncbi:hypothetical protein [Streptomyces luteogriseus]|uniref:hypothetical protein n=1 Tax=Streptomyces luteogriseus TaxID=68233 RepID=UPI0038285CF4